MIHIPQGTVGNNLGPERLTGPEVLDSDHYRHPTHWLHDLCLEVLTVTIIVVVILSVSGDNLLK